MKNQFFVRFMLCLFFLGVLLAAPTKKPGKGDPFSFQEKNQKKGVISGVDNEDLKSELIDLEATFKKDHEAIKINYRNQISSLKEMQKQEVKKLKKDYNQQRRAIYKKYGVKPPKKNSENKKDETEVVPSTKNKKRLFSPKQTPTNK